MNGMSSQDVTTLYPRTQILRMSQSGFFIASSFCNLLFLLRCIKSIESFDHTNLYRLIDNVLHLKIALFKNSDLVVFLITVSNNRKPKRTPIGVLHLCCRNNKSAMMILQQTESMARTSHMDER
jgi:hypothetical protein